MTLQGTVARAGRQIVQNMKKIIKTECRQVSKNQIVYGNREGGLIISYGAYIIRECRYETDAVYFILDNFCGE